jgi:hypothetical protein
LWTDRHLDLCEDEDVQIRRQAIKDLPLLCKDNSDYTPKIADILAQLLVAEDAAELQQVHQSLQQLVKMDAKGALTGMFSQIIAGDEQTRYRNFQFLSGKFMKMEPEIITKEIEEFIITEIKKIMMVSLIYTNSNIRLNTNSTFLLGCDVRRIPHVYGHFESDQIEQNNYGSQRVGCDCYGAGRIRFRPRNVGGRG